MSINLSQSERHKQRLVEQLERLREQLAEMNIQKAILFGSLARGDVTVFSDVDLLIVQETSARFLDRLEPFYAQLDLHTDVDILVYTPAEMADMTTWNPLVRQALREGKVIYEADAARAIELTTGVIHFVQTRFEKADQEPENPKGADA